MVSILGKSIAIALKEKRLDYWDFSDKNSWMSKIFRQKPLIANWELTGKQTYSLVHGFFFFANKMETNTTHGTNGSFEVYRSKLVQVHKKRNRYLRLKILISALYDFNTFLTNYAYVPFCYNIAFHTFQFVLSYIIQYTCTWCHSLVLRLPR